MERRRRLLSRGLRAAPQTRRRRPGHDLPGATAPCSAWSCSSGTTGSPPRPARGGAQRGPAPWRGSAARSSRRATGWRPGRRDRPGRGIRPRPAADRADGGRAGRQPGLQWAVTRVRAQFTATSNYAKRADELDKATEAAQKADCWDEAIAKADELLALRMRAQGPSISRRRMRNGVSIRCAARPRCRRRIESPTHLQIP